MRNFIVCVLLCTLAVGCGRKEESSVAAPAAEAMGAAKAAGDERRRFMAYEHSIALDVEEDQVAPIHKSVEAACVAAVADECVILESNLRVGREVYAEIKLRAKPEGVKKIAAVLATQGKVIRQSVQAEDLAEPIGDSARRLKMLQDYRAQLEVLRGRAGGDIESLIKVSKELSEVQGQLEALSGEQAHLYRRVNTELLNVSVSSRSGESFWRPVGSALGDFKSHFGEGISAVITAMAYLIPWAVLLAAIWLSVRKFRAWKAKRA